MKKLNKITIFAICILAIALTVGSTLAFLIDSDGPVENTFTGSKVTSEVVEEFKDGVKKDVKIKNTGDTPAYIRAAIVVTWKDAEGGNVLGQVPKPGEDYSIAYNTDEQTEPAGKWAKEGNYYYWSNPVEPGKTTGVLITECKQLKTITVGNTTYYLNVEIICSAIQAGQDGYGEAYNAWKGVAVND